MREREGGRCLLFFFNFSHRSPLSSPSLHPGLCNHIPGLSNNIPVSLITSRYLSDSLSLSRTTLICSAVRRDAMEERRSVCFFSSFSLLRRTVAAGPRVVGAGGRRGHQRAQRQKRRSAGHRREGGKKGRMGRGVN